MASPDFEGKCTKCEGWHGPTIEFGPVVNSGSGVGLAQACDIWFWCCVKLERFRPTAVRRSPRHA